MKRLELRSFIYDLNNNDFIKQCGIPIGYKACFPVIKTKANKVFIMIPYNKVQRSATPGVSCVFPFSYTVTFELFAVMSIPNGLKISRYELGYANAKPVSFETLAYLEKFETIAFDKPIESFPHRELKEYGKQEYERMVERLYQNYDAIINDLLGIEKAAGIDKLEFKQNMACLIGPKTKHLYQLLDRDFFDRYLTQ